MKKEILLNFIFTILVNGILFVQNKYFISSLGIESLGIIKLFNQLLQYLNIIEMGIGSASAYALYKPLANKDEKTVSIIVSTLMDIYNKIAIGIFVVGLLITVVIPFLVKIEEFNKIQICIYWILYLINTVSTYLYVKYIILFTANQEFIKVKYIQSTSKVVYQIIQIICLIKFRSIYIYILVLLLDNLTQYIFFKMHFLKNYSYIYKTKERFSGIKSDIKKLFWHKIGGLVVFNTDLILISKLTSIETVGIYSSYLMVFQILSTILNVFYSILTPRIGKYIAQNSRENSYNLFKQQNILFIILGIILIYPTFELINVFVGLWLGKNYILDKLTVILMSINNYINLVRWLLEAYKNGFGYFDDIQSPIYESLINLICSIFLGIKYGLKGIIAGTIISNIIVIMIFKPIFVFENCFKKSLKEYIKIYGYYLILLTISFSCLVFFTRNIKIDNINNWKEFIMYSIIIFFEVCIIVFPIFFLLDKEFRKLIKSNIKFIKKVKGIK